MAWEFKREESNGFNTNVPEGKHRIRIKSAEKAVSKSGNDMLVLQFDISGFNEILYHYIVFMQDRPEITNRMLTQFFDAFKDIPEGEFNMQKWIGKVGACTVKHDEYNGSIKSKVGYFIAADKQGDLPAWKEPGQGKIPARNAKPDVPVDENGFMAIADGVNEEVPFL